MYVLCELVLDHDVSLSVPKLITALRVFTTRPADCQTIGFLARPFWLGLGTRNFRAWEALVKFHVFEESWGFGKVVATNGVNLSNRSIIKFGSLGSYFAKRLNRSGNSVYRNKTKH
jgi:hypothetical protein